MTIVNVSVSYRTAPAEVLEKVAVPAGQRRGMLAWLHAMPSIDEVAILSTCNRAEVYAVTRGPVGEAARAAAGALAARGWLPAADVTRLSRTHAGAAAVTHLFAVTCGLDSMAVGEEQIAAQVKEAGQAAAAAGTTGPVLAGLFGAALHTSKRARTETAIGTAGISLARAGLGLARAHLGGDLTGRAAVVVGTGTMGRLAARLLREAGAGELAIVSRSEAKAAGVAAAAGGRPVPAARLGEAIAGADILVTATGATAPLVLAADVRAARKPAGGRPLFVLDLGMPADVEPAAGDLPGVALVNLTALGRHLAGRDAGDQVPRARAIVAGEVRAYLDRQRQAAAGPVIAELHAQIRQLADAELARLHDRLPDLSDQQRAETAATVHRILRKILHRPTVRAREASAGPDGPAQLESLRQLFGLATGEPAGAPEGAAGQARA